MKKITFRIIALMGLFVVASCAPKGDRTAEMMDKLELGEIPDEVDVYVLLPEQSALAWAGQNIVGKAHDGTIGIKAGELYIYEEQLLSGFVEIDMTNIVVLDIEDPGMNARLKGHLESDDFFSVADYPVSRLDIVQFEAIEGAVSGAPNYRLKGNLTIKGISHGIAFDAYIDRHDNHIHATADVTFDRSLYDVRFGSGRFFDNLGDNLILDEITMRVSITAEL